MTYRKTLFAICCTLLLSIHTTYAKTTTRIQQFANDKVKVWETYIYPKSTAILPMHRHENDRVVVALSSGTLKITNNQGKTHYLELKKNKSYYLKKDPSNELHSDENIGTKPIKVIVIELLK